MITYWIPVGTEEEQAYVKFEAADPCKECGALVLKSSKYFHECWHRTLDPDEQWV